MQYWSITQRTHYMYMDPSSPTDYNFGTCHLHGPYREPWVKCFEPGLLPSCSLPRCQCHCQRGQGSRVCHSVSPTQPTQLLHCSLSHCLPDQGSPTLHGAVTSRELQQLITVARNGLYSYNAFGFHLIHGHKTMKAEWSVSIPPNYSHYSGLLAFIYFFYSNNVYAWQWYRQIATEC